MHVLIATDLRTCWIHHRVAILPNTYLIPPHDFMPSKVATDTVVVPSVVPSVREKAVSHTSWLDEFKFVLIYYIL